MTNTEKPTLSHEAALARITELRTALLAMSGRCTPEAQLTIDRVLSDEPHDSELEAKSTVQVSEDEAVEIMYKAYGDTPFTKGMRNQLRAAYNALLSAGIITKTRERD